MAISPILILPIHDLFLLVLSSISLFNVLRFLLYKYFTYFFLCMFAVCIKENYWFCELIFYLAALLNVFINYRSFLLEPLGFSMYGTTSSENENSLVSSFLTYIPFPSSSRVALRLQALYLIKVERADILVLFLIVVEMLWVSPHLGWRWLWVCCPLALVHCFYVPRISSFLRTFPWRCFTLCWRPFVQVRCSCDFYAWVYLHGGSHLLIYASQTIPVSFGWS